MELSVLSLVPPILAIVCALFLRQILLSLLLGIYSAALLMNNGDPLKAMMRALDGIIVPAMATSEHTTIIIFSVSLGGLIGIIAANGGTQGLVNSLVRYAHTARGGQFVTWLMGMMIFFDDYANSLLVGNAMRPVTDRLRVSREKLAYIIDSTAAPVSAITLSTWIGYEVGLIGSAMSASNIPGNGFAVFLTSLSSRFYPILTIFFVLCLIVMRRDYGPMWKAEYRARKLGLLSREGATLPVDLSDLHSALDPDRPGKWWNALVPILTVVLVAMFGLYTSGTAALNEQGVVNFSWMEILGSAQSGYALLWGTCAGNIVALVMSRIQGIMTITQSMDAWVKGVRSMSMAMIILILAWGMGDATKLVGTADYLVHLLGDSLSSSWIPLWTFLIAAATSFATGTSWGTMAILMPIVVPLCAATSGDLSSLAGSPNFLSSISAVLAGSILGDHCSPISDTTVLSSMASACDHIDHTKTQLPYALTVGVICVGAGYIPIGLGLSAGISLVIGLFMIPFTIYALGRPVVTN